MEGRRVVRNYRKKTSVKRILSITLLLLLAVVAAGVYLKKFNNDKDTYTPIAYEPVTEMTEDKNKGYAISTSCKEATDAGVKVLENGGNAVDAAIAVSYTLAVAEPYASGLGGGGCMLVFDPATEKYYFYNYGAEAAASGFSSTVLVPGMVSGMEAVRTDFGTMSLSELLEEPIKYCDGFDITEVFAVRIDRASGMLGENSIYCENGRWLSTGDKLVQPELKETLMTLASEGADSFYTGSIASKISSEIGMSMGDLEAYETIRTDAVMGEYGEYTVASAAAPYSGMTLVQMLKMSEKLNMPSPDDNNQAFVEGLQRITATAHNDRVSHVYDYRFAKSDIDESQYVTDAYISELLNLDYSNYEEEESEDTTAFSIIDGNGMIVVCTNTLSSYFGAKIEVGGFYLNNSGGNFGTVVNAYAPGKRPRTHISPTILRAEDEILAIASPGGNAIVKILATVISDICRYGTDAETAVNKQRLMFKTSDVIYYEIGYDTENFATAGGVGFTTIPSSDHSLFGCVALAGYNVKEGYYAVADPRRDSLAEYINKK